MISKLLQRYEISGEKTNKTIKFYLFSSYSPIFRNFAHVIINQRKGQDEKNDDGCYHIGNNVEHKRSE